MPSSLGILFLGITAFLFLNIMVPLNTYNYKAFPNNAILKNDNGIFIYNYNAKKPFSATKIIQLEVEDPDPHTLLFAPGYNIDKLQTLNFPIRPTLQVELLDKNNINKRVTSGPNSKYGNMTASDACTNDRFNDFSDENKYTMMANARRRWEYMIMMRVVVGSIVLALLFTFYYVRKRVMLMRFLMNTDWQADWDRMLYNLGRYMRYGYPEDIMNEERKAIVNASTIFDVLWQEQGRTIASLRAEVERLKIQEMQSSSDLIREKQRVRVLSADLRALRADLDEERRASDIDINMKDAIIDDLNELNNDYLEEYESIKAREREVEREYESIKRAKEREVEFCTSKAYDEISKQRAENNELRSENRQRFESAGSDIDARIDAIISDLDQHSRKVFGLESEIGELPGIRSWARRKVIRKDIIALHKSYIDMARTQLIDLRYRPKPRFK